MAAKKPDKIMHEPVMPRPKVETLITRVHSWCTPVVTPMGQTVIPTPFVGIRLFCLQQQFYEYELRCLLVLEHKSDRYLYVPTRPAGKAPQWRMETLPVVREADVERWLKPIRQRFDALYYSDDRLEDSDPSAPPITAMVDAALWIRQDLVRLPATNNHALQATLALLDLLACFRGKSHNVPFPRILFGSDAIQLLQLRQAEALTGPVLAELKAENTVQLADGSRRYVAVVDRKECPFGVIDGYYAEVAIVTLTVSFETSQWSYERQVVWSERVIGEPW